MADGKELISLVVPVYFEEECILQFIKEVTDVFNSLPYEHEFIFVDDGSKDKTVELIKNAAQTNKHIKLVEFSYNHGKQAAVTAAIKHAKGDYMLYMDPDLQDPPVEIPRFIDEIKKGYDLVFGVRIEKKDKVLNIIFSKLFWWILEKFTGLQIPRGLAVMRIFNRKFADRFIDYPEQNRFIEGIFMHIGLKRSTIVISQRERFAGTSKFNFRKKMRLAFDAIFDFSELPLKITVKIGFIMVLISIISLVAILITRLFFIKFQAGWPSLFTIITGVAGLQLFFTGIIAIYIGRIYKEVKKRPLYSVKELTNMDV